MNTNHTNHNRLTIVADRGLMRAYREVREFADHQPHLKLIEEVKPEAAHEKLSDQVSDQSGRFPRGSGAGSIPGDMSAGERLHLEAELDRRLIETLAGKINALLEDDEVSRCSLAASAPIYKQLLEALSPKARSKVHQFLASDLAKADPAELPGHFERAAS